MEFLNFWFWGEIKIFLISRGVGLSYEGEGGIYFLEKSVHSVSVSFHSSVGT